MQVIHLIYLFAIKRKVKQRKRNAGVLCTDVDASPFMDAMM